MGYIDLITHQFVSELTTVELAEYKLRASWLAERWFTSHVIESFDLGNLPTGYMTAEISTNYRPGQRRIWFYINKQLVQTMRYDAGQSGRQKARDYYSVVLNHQREQCNMPRRLVGTPEEIAS